MRNLKRALSLALASVMLLGMMVVGTSAASIDGFTDADEISNKEAVAIATGLGIFDGYTDGSFGPDKVVTRAEMAVVIAKILHGSDVDPANFVGASRFTDVPAWAEGYVNLADSLNIIEGYSETTFGTNDPVTTVQASTMLLKALGYYVDEETALGGDWKLQVTSKATALGLYGDLSLNMDAGLTRENVAELVFNALFAQRVAFNDYRGQYVKATDRDVVVTNGTKDEMNTLAQNVYGLYAVEGVVVANGMTDMYLEGKTAVVFDEEKDVTGDKKAEAEYSFKYETGLDYVGHAVTVYYEIVKKAPAVYAIVDNATQAVATVMTDNLSNLAKAEGFAKDTSETVIVYNYDLENVVDNYKAYEDEIVYLISNSSDLTVDYAIVVESTLDSAKKILVNDADEDDVILTYDLAANGPQDDDKTAIALNEIEEEDFVLVTKIAGRGIDGNDLYLIEAAYTEDEEIVTVTRNSKKTETILLASEAVDYVKSSVVIEDVIVADDSIIPYAAVEMEGEYVLVFDTIDRLIGVAPLTEETTMNAAYVAQFGVKINTDPTLFDKYALYTHVYFADGTDGVYVVDVADSNVFAGGKATVENGKEYFIFNYGKDNQWKLPVIENGAKSATYNMNNAVEGNGDYIGLYDVTVDGSKIELDALKVKYAPANVEQVKKGVTYLGAMDDVNLYANSKTVLFYVSGVYGSDLDVEIVTGIKDAYTIDMTKATAATEDDAVVGEVYGEAKTGYNAANYMMINGYEFVEEIEGLYYYNEIYKVIDTKDGKFDLVFYVYDFATGEATTVTYENFGSDAAARAKADGLTNGYYTMGTTNSRTLVPYYTAELDATKNSDETNYTVDADFLKFIDFGDVLTMYTTEENNAAGTTVDEETIIVDLTGNKLTSLETMNRLIEARQKIWAQNDETNTETATLVYDVAKDNTVGVIYIVDIIAEYDKDYTGTGSDEAAAPIYTAAIKDGKIVVTADLRHLAGVSVTVKTSFTAQEIGDLLAEAGYTDIKCVNGKWSCNKGYESFTDLTVNPWTNIVAK